MGERYWICRVKVSIPRTRSEELGKDREPLGKGNRLPQVQVKKKKKKNDVSAPPTWQMSNFSLEAQKSLTSRSSLLVNHPLLLIVQNGPEYWVQVAAKLS